MPKPHIRHAFIALVSYAGIGHSLDIGTRDGETEMSNEYITTRPVPAALVGIIETMLPSYARSIVCLHGDTDADPVRYRAHRNEIEIVRHAIRVAKSRA